MVQLLLDRGVDVHFENDFSFIHAAANGHVNVVALLLDQGADIHAQNDSAMYWASENIQQEVVGATIILQLLLSRGANLAS